MAAAATGLGHNIVQTSGLSVDSQDECALCLETIDQKPYAGHTTADKAHIFCLDCFTKFAKTCRQEGNAITCPCCRLGLDASIIPQALPLPAPAAPAAPAADPAANQFHNNNEFPPLDHFPHEFDPPFEAGPLVPCYLAFPNLITRITGIPLMVTTMITYTLANIALIVTLVALAIIFVEFTFLSNFFIIVAGVISIVGPFFTLLMIESASDYS